MARYVISTSRKGREAGVDAIMLATNIQGVSIENSLNGRAVIEVTEDILAKVQLQLGNLAIIEPIILHDRLESWSNEKE